MISIKKIILLLACCILAAAGPACTESAKQNQAFEFAVREKRFPQQTVDTALSRIERIYEQGPVRPSPLPAIRGTKATVLGLYEGGRSVEGRILEYYVLGQGEEVVLIIAGIHGDEPAGSSLVSGLSRYLIKRVELLNSRRVVLVPLANPDGIIRNCRHNAHDVDLNRNFNSRNRKDYKHYGTALSEPESRFIEKLITKFRPARIISIHQVTRSNGELEKGLVDYDGPGEKLATRMAQYCPLKVRKWGAQPGSLGSYAGVDLHIPTVTLELPKNSQKLPIEKLWRLYGRPLIVAIIYPDNLALVSTGR